MKIWNIVIGLVTLYMLYGCADKNIRGNLDVTIIDFGNPKALGSSDVISDYAYVKLDDSEHSLVGGIDQLEYFHDISSVCTDICRETLTLFHNKAERTERLCMAIPKVI